MDFILVKDLHHSSICCNIVRYIVLQDNVKTYLSGEFAGSFRLSKNQKNRFISAASESKEAVKFWGR
jgi:hypothetical protein